jgi:hypothetical protein
MQEHLTQGQLTQGHLTQDQWESYRIATEGRNVWLVGSNPRGTAFAAYTLSERLGIDPIYIWSGYRLEMPIDVTFTVDVIRGSATSQVRAETRDYLISFGVSGSVPESIQLATTQLAEWIKKDYKLNDREIALLFGDVLKYDITELVDPRFNVAAKVPKSVLATLNK